MNTAEIRMLNWVENYERWNKKNQHIQEHLGGASINDKLKETHLKRFAHVQRNTRRALVRKFFYAGSWLLKKMGRAKRTCV